MTSEVGVISSIERILPVNTVIPTENVDPEDVDPIVFHIQLQNYLQESLQIHPPQRQQQQPDENCCALLLTDFIGPCSVLCTQLAGYIRRFENYLSLIHPETPHRAEIVEKGERLLQWFYIVHRLLWIEFNQMSASSTL